MAPPRLPRRTDTSPSVSRIRSASRSETRLTLNCSTSTSWRGSKSPSASSPSMIWRRNSSATISAIRGADKRRRASGPIPSAVIGFQQRNDRTEPRPVQLWSKRRSAKLLRWYRQQPDDVGGYRLSSEQDSRPTPLDDVRVVEISDRIAGSYCGKLLVDAGAEVRKIEPPQGDPLRRYSASCSPMPDGTDSPLFGYLNAGKRSLTWAAAGPHSDG